MWLIYNIFTYELIIPINGVVRIVECVCNPHKTMTDLNYVAPHIYNTKLSGISRVPVCRLIRLIAHVGCYMKHLEVIMLR